MAAQIVAAAALALGASLSGTVGTAAQGVGVGTPPPDAPAPEACSVAPLGFDALNRIIAGGAPLAAGAAGTPLGRGMPVPIGTPAPPETEAAVRAVVREYVACQNAGELLRAYALYTDAYLARLFLRQGAWDEAAYLGLATPMPEPPEDRTAILSIRDVRILPDGRIGATVTLAYRSVPVPKTFFFTFVREGDRWTIDDILGEISFSVP